MSRLRSSCPAKITASLALNAVIDGLTPGPPTCRRCRTLMRGRVREEVELQEIIHLPQESTHIKLL